MSATCFVDANVLAYARDLSEAGMPTRAREWLEARWRRSRDGSASLHPPALCEVRHDAPAVAGIINRGNGKMRITINIDEAQLAAVQQATGLTGKAPAIRKAIEDHLAGLARRRFLERVLKGETDYALTNDELERRAMWRSRQQSACG